MSQRISLCSFAAVIMMALPAAAQEAPSDEMCPKRGEERVIKLEALPADLARIMADDRKMLAQVGISGPEGAAKGLVALNYVWTLDYPIVKVCFFGGNRKTNARVAKIAHEWKKAVPGVPLDFGNLEDPRTCKPDETNHIRVAFHDPKVENQGFWSALGKVGLKRGQGEHTMNLEGLDKQNLKKLDKDPEKLAKFRRVVLHEFGHALGLNHEHQHPWANCDAEYDWNKIYKNMGGWPYCWDKEKIDNNMRQLHGEGHWMSNYDAKSIMRYYFEPWYYKKGKKSSCYSRETMEMSAGDIEILRRFYPEDLAQRTAVQAEMRKQLMTAIENSGVNRGAKSTAAQLIDEYVPESTSENISAEQ